MVSNLNDFLNQSKHALLDEKLKIIIKARVKSWFALYIIDTLTLV
jgi:hypothetical protein